MATPVIDTAQLLRDSQSFYNSSFNNLLVLIGFSFAIIGIIVPLFIMWWQNKQLIINENKLINDFDKKYKELEVRIMDEFTKKSEELRVMIIESQAAANGTSFLSQAQNYLQQEKYPEALLNLFFSLNNWMINGDENQVASSLQLVYDYFPAVKDKSSLSHFRYILEDVIDTLVTFDRNRKSKYNKDIIMLNKLLEEIPIK